MPFYYITLGICVCVCVCVFRECCLHVMSKVRSPHLYLCTNSFISKYLNEEAPGTVLIELALSSYPFSFDHVIFLWHHNHTLNIKLKTDIKVSVYFIKSLLNIVILLQNINNKCHFKENLLTQQMILFLIHTLLLTYSFLHDTSSTFQCNPLAL